MSRLNRLPIRLRVTLAFATVMAVVLGGVGLFLYLRLGSVLDTTIEQGLRSRAADVSALIEQDDPGLRDAPRSPLAEQGENPAQILDLTGRVIDGTATADERSLLTPGQRSRAARESVFVTTSGREDSVRLLAAPVAAGGRRFVVVVGAPLEAREEAVSSLGRLLLLGGPAALLLAAVTGYGALAAALKPVESMRRQAAAIDEAAPGGRLPVPDADDEIGRLGDTLNAMLGRLEAAFARERTFVSDASHELRTPLAILKAELELALRGGHSVRDLEDALRSAAEETDRLVQLAEDLLVIARSDQGKLPVRLGDVRADDVLNGIRGRFARRAEERQATIDIDAPGSLRLVADRLRLEQAVGNMVDNALRHGGGNIELTAAEIGDAVELHVLDDGEGFPDEFLPEAFERFTRSDAARGRGGTGLGLAIVAAIARAHGGDVAARNRAGGGADVWLTLPRR